MNRITLAQLALASAAIVAASVWLGVATDRTALVLHGALRALDAEDRLSRGERRARETDGARPLAGRARGGARGVPADDQLDRDRPVHPVAAARDRSRAILRRPRWRRCSMTNAALGRAGSFRCSRSRSAWRSSWPSGWATSAGSASGRARSHERRSASSSFSAGGSTWSAGSAATAETSTGSGSTSTRRRSPGS